MTNGFHLMTYETHFMTEPTNPDNFNRWVCPRVFFSGEQITVYWRMKPKPGIVE